jgi:hypothetical protein
MANVNDPKSILAAIQNLSSKRHVISDEAIKAKEELDDTRKLADDQRQAEVDKRWNKKLAIIEEFNESVTLLMSIFQNSQFDELAMFAANPARVLVINFLIGILRGVGFAIGFLLMLLITLVLVKQALPQDFVIHLITYLQRILAAH